MIKSNLLMLLAERRLSAARVSKDTGISRTTLSSISSNQAKGIQYDTMDALCIYLNVSPGELFAFVPFNIGILPVTVQDTEICFIVDEKGRPKKLFMGFSVDVRNKAMSIKDLKAIDNVISDDTIVNVKTLYIPTSVYIDIKPISENVDIEKARHAKELYMYIKYLPASMFSSLEQEIKGVIIDRIEQDLYDAYTFLSEQYIIGIVGNLDVKITLHLTQQILQSLI